YGEFVAHRLSHLRKGRDSPAPPVRPRSDRSLIRFHGQPILSPLLSGERREEMRALKEHLKKPAVRGKSEAGGRVALVQNMLRSVQLWKAPTLQEFFQEKSGLHILSPSDATS
ncbi:hypothetical protein CRUP_002991, partial [Coryphaenoides rupestris]